MGNGIVLFEPIKPRERLPVDLQGEGTYEYKCDDPRCYYCEKMGLNSVVNREDVSYNTKQQWSKRELNRLKELITLPPKQLKPLFPRRTLAAISTQKTMLKQKNLAA